MDSHGFELVDIERDWIERTTCNPFSLNEPTAITNNKQTNRYNFYQNNDDCQEHNPYYDYIYVFDQEPMMRQR